MATPPLFRWNMQVRLYDVCVSDSLGSDVFLLFNHRTSSKFSSCVSVFEGCQPQVNDLSNLAAGFALGPLGYFSLLCVPAIVN